MHVYVTVHVGHVSTGTDGGQRPRQITWSWSYMWFWDTRGGSWQVTQVLCKSKKCLELGDHLSGIWGGGFILHKFFQKLTKFKAYSNLLFKKIQVSRVTKMAQRVKALPANWVQAPAATGRGEPDSCMSSDLLREPPCTGTCRSVLMGKQNPTQKRLYKTDIHKEMGRFK